MDEENGSCRSGWIFGMTDPLTMAGSEDIFRLFLIESHHTT